MAEAAFAGPVRPGKTALRIGSYGQEGKAVNFYNGDVAMCAIYDRALNEEQVKKRFADRGLNLPAPDRLLACWPFGIPCQPHWDFFCLASSSSSHRTTPLGLPVTPSSHCDEHSNSAFSVLNFL